MSPNGGVGVMAALHNHVSINLTIVLLATAVALKEEISFLESWKRIEGFFVLGLEYKDVSSSVLEKKGGF